MLHFLASSEAEGEGTVDVRSMRGAGRCLRLKVLSGVTIGATGADCDVWLRVRLCPCKAIADVDE